MRMTIGKKLGGLVLLNVVLLVIVLGIAFNSLDKIVRQDISSVFKTELPEVRYLNSIMIELKDQIKEVVDYAWRGEEEDKEGFEETKVEIYESFDKAMSLLEDEGEKNKLGGIKGDYEKILVLSSQIITLKDQGKSEELRELSEKLEVPAEDLEKKLKVFIDEEQEETFGHLGEFDKFTKTRTTLLMILGLVGIILSIFIGTLISYRISSSIGRLTTTTTLATKAADLTQVVEVKTKDEIGQLGEAYNKLIESLRGIIKQIRDAGFQVTTASNQILTASQQQATGIEEEATQISQTATSAKQLATTAKQVTDHGNEIAKVSASTVQMANSGSQAVENAIKGMERIKESVLETAKKIEGLGERSQAITEIVSLIEDIADQTNLLSLNAAIEAARAGEQGKGFAVVADAIGKLAERTTKSTKDISDLIKAIQQDTSGAVLSMEESTKETEKGASLAQEAGKAIKEIVSSFQQVAQSAKEISLSSQQQSSGSEQISKAMTGIDQIMKQSAAGAKQSTESARQLSALAEGLKKAVGQFKLGEGERVV